MKLITNKLLAEQWDKYFTFTEIGGLCNTLVDCHIYFWYTNPELIKDHLKG